jgi:hypothetical protein
VLVWPLGETRHEEVVLADKVKELKCVKGEKVAVPSREDGVAWLMSIPAYTEPVDTTAVKLL